MLERLVGNEYYFLDRYSGYNQIAPEDQEKTIFTCLLGTFAYHHMLFGLCNALIMVHTYIISNFSDMVERFFEVFMDDLTFSKYFYHFKLILVCCKVNLTLNWRSVTSWLSMTLSWDMSFQIGGLVDKAKIDLIVNKAKIDLIVHLPPPSKSKIFGHS